MKNLYHEISRKEERKMPGEMLVWVIGCVVFVLIEAATPCLVSIWFSGGCVAGFVAQLCGAPFWLQCLLFFVVSVGLLFCLRPFLRKYVNPKKQATNVQSLIGKTAIVTERIDNLHGEGAVKVGGIPWSARSADETVIPPDTQVTIVRIEGVKAIVEPLKAPAKTN
ncbi:MAG: NfeD family protein [Firmicutes bacterium]|nr:NfeD family protein [Bacillota bacterium]